MDEAVDLEVPKVINGNVKAMKVASQIKFLANNYDDLDLGYNSFKDAILGYAMALSNSDTRDNILNGRKYEAAREAPSNINYKTLNAYIDGIKEATDILKNKFIKHSKDRIQ